MSEGFSGFSSRFFRFFEELAANNKREWFEANKARYKEEVVGPLTAFIAAMAPRLAKISEHYNADPRPNGGSMFRIYRDVRFSMDKRPYKEHGACQFRHRAGKDAHAPGYYVHLEPGRIFFGGGVWMPPSPQLRMIRSSIADDPDGWGKVLKSKRFKETFGSVHGEGLKRPPRDFDPDHPYIEDIKRKSFFAMREARPTLAGSPDFVKEVEATFKAATPMMKFLNNAIGVPF